MLEFDFTREPQITQQMVRDFTTAYHRQHGKALSQLLDVDQRTRLAAFLGRGSFHTDLPAFARALERIPADPLDLIENHHARMPEQGLEVIKQVDPDVFSRFVMSMVDKALREQAEEDCKQGITPPAA